MRQIFTKILSRLNGSGKDTRILLISFLLAFSVWFIHNLSLKYSGVISVPVTAVSNLDGHSDKSSDVVTVTARCRTSGFRMLAARYTNRKALVTIDKTDLKRKGDGWYYLSGPVLNNYAQQIFGDGTTVEAFISDTLLFRFPAELHKKIPVEVNRVINFRPQYTATGPLRIDPDSVIIYGDERRLSLMDKVYSEPLRLNDVHNSLHGVLRINGADGIRLSDTEVKYSVEVSRFVEMRSTVPVEIRNAPSRKGLRVFPSMVDIVVDCAFPPQSDVTEDVTVYIDYNDFANSRTGRCVLKVEKGSPNIIACRTEPEVVDCIETD